MQNMKSPKKPIYWYYLAAVLIILVLNATLFPSLMARSVKEVTYSTFLDWIEEGRIKDVEMDADEIIFTAYGSDELSLIHIYNINKGYAVFREIKIIDENEEYCIVEEGSTFGLAQYDHIVLDASTVKDEDIVY